MLLCTTYNKHVALVLAKSRLDFSCNFLRQPLLFLLVGWLVGWLVMGKTTVMDHSTLSSK